MDRGAWWATVHGVAQSQTRLKQLSTGDGLQWRFIVALKCMFPVLFYLCAFFCEAFFYAFCTLKNRGILSYCCVTIILFIYSRNKSSADRCVTNIFSQAMAYGFVFPQMSFEKQMF